DPTKADSYRKKVALLPDGGASGAGGAGGPNGSGGSGGAGGECFIDILDTAGQEAYAAIRDVAVIPGADPATTTAMTTASDAATDATTDMASAPVDRMVVLTADARLLVVRWRSASSASLAACATSPAAPPARSSMLAPVVDQVLPLEDLAPDDVFFGLDSDARGRWVVLKRRIGPPVVYRLHAHRLVRCPLPDDAQPSPPWPPSTSVVLDAVLLGGLLPRRGVREANKHVAEAGAAEAHVVVAVASASGMHIAARPLLAPSPRWEIVSIAQLLADVGMKEPAPGPESSEAVVERLIPLPHAPGCLGVVYGRCLLIVGTSTGIVAEAGFLVAPHWGTLTAVGFVATATAATLTGHPGVTRRIDASRAWLCTDRGAVLSVIRRSKVGGDQHPSVAATSTPAGTWHMDWLSTRLPALTAVVPIGPLAANCVAAGAAGGRSGGATGAWSTRPADGARALIIDAAGAVRFFHLRATPSDADAACSTVSVSVGVDGLFMDMAGRAAGDSPGTATSLFGIPRWVPVPHQGTEAIAADGALWHGAAVVRRRADAGAASRTEIDISTETDFGIGNDADSDLDTDPEASADTNVDASSGPPALWRLTVTQQVDIITPLPQLRGVTHVICLGALREPLPTVDGSGGGAMAGRLYRYWRMIRYERAHLFEEVWDGTRSVQWRELSDPLLRPRDGGIDEPHAAHVGTLLLDGTPGTASRAVHVTAAGARGFWRPPAHTAITHVHSHRRGVWLQLATAAIVWLRYLPDAPNGPVWAQAAQLARPHAWVCVATLDGHVSPSCRPPHPESSRGTWRGEAAATALHITVTDHHGIEIIQSTDPTPTAPGRLSCLRRVAVASLLGHGPSVSRDLLHDEDDADSVADSDSDASEWHDPVAGVATAPSAGCASKAHEVDAVHRGPDDDAGVVVSLGAVASPSGSWLVFGLARGELALLPLRWRRPGASTAAIAFGRRHRRPLGRGPVALTQNHVDPGTLWALVDGAVWTVRAQSCSVRVARLAFRDV
ncbi:hypothetical protein CAUPRSCDRAFT_11783, partial [Caulochytrium protostelioides]